MSFSPSGPSFFSLLVERFGPDFIHDYKNIFFGFCDFVEVFLGITFLLEKYQPWFV